MEQTYRVIQIKDVCQMLQNGQLVVPSYQRSFIWGEVQQRKLIESLLQGHPIGVIIVTKDEGSTIYEIVDGQQRLKTIFYYIETGFRGSWNGELLSTADQERFLCIPLNFIILSGIKEPSEIVNVFQIINTAGEMLNTQELRQVGFTGDFAQTVAMMAAELRHSGWQKSFQDCIWYRLGLFTEKEVLRGEDQVLIARLVLAILTGKLQGRNEAQLDRVYSLNSVEFQETRAQLLAHSIKRLTEEMRLVFSFFMALPVVKIHEQYTVEVFYILFLASFDLAVKKKMTFCDCASLFSALNAAQLVIPKQPESTQYEELKNYALWRLNACFAGEDTQILNVDAEFENSLRCSNVETARYEFKQGFLRLSSDRVYDKRLEGQILETLCGMANICSTAPSFLYIGVADNRVHAERISYLDNLQPVEVAGHYVVGIQREVELMNTTVEEYCNKIKEFIDHSNLSRHLIISVLTHMEIFNYKGLIIVRLVVPPQDQLSYYGDDIYLRKHSSTVKLTNPHEIVATARRFST